MNIGDKVKHKPGVFSHMCVKDRKSMQDLGAVMDYTTIVVVLSNYSHIIDLSDGFDMDERELELITVLDLCAEDKPPHWANIDRIRDATTLSDKELLSLGCPKELL